MDFTIPKTHQLFHRMVQEFAEQEVRPVAKQVDVQGWPDMNVVRKLGENGLLGVPFPQKYGGSGLGELGYCLLMETMGAVCTSTATTIGAHIGIGAMSIYLGGTEAQKRKYLPDLATGKKIAAFCLTEPGAGSDAAAIKTRAIRDGDKYIITGSKIYITNGPIADTFTVLAVTDPNLGARGGVTAFIVESGTPGLSVGTIEHKLGIHGSATSEIVFDEVVVPSANVLGQVGAGFVTFMATLDTGRLGLGAACLGGAQAALDSMCPLRRRPQPVRQSRSARSRRSSGSSPTPPPRSRRCARWSTARPGWWTRLSRTREEAACASSSGLRSPRGPLTGRCRSTGRWATAATSRWSARGATPASPRSSRGRTRFNGSSSPGKCCGRMGACVVVAGSWKLRVKLET